MDIPWTEVLDKIPSDKVFKMCLLNTSFHDLCPGYLQQRARKEFKDSHIIVNSINDYIAILTLRTGFVTRGSEKYIPLDEALYRSVTLGKRSLINYMLRQSPEADQGCNSRHVKLVVVAAALLVRRNILQEILSSCNFNRGFLYNLQHLDFMRDALLDYDSPSMIEKYLDIDYSPSDVAEIAAERGNLFTLKYLLENYPDLIPVNYLEPAARGDYLDIIEYLMPMLTDDDIQYAFGRVNNNVARYFLENCKNLDLLEALRSAAEYDNEHTENIDSIIEVGGLDPQKALEVLMEEDEYSEDVILHIISSYKGLDLDAAIRVARENANDEAVRIIKEYVSKT